MLCCCLSYAMPDEETHFIPVLDNREKIKNPSKNYNLARISLQIYALFMRLKDHFPNSSNILKTSEKYSLTEAANIFMHVMLIQNMKTRKLVLKTVKKTFGTTHYKFFRSWNDTPVVIIPSGVADRAHKTPLAVPLLSPA